MSNLKMFCLTLDPQHESLIKEMGYIPVGLGNKKFSDNCLNDKQGINISEKNDNYGEYTFHYNLWKNQKIELNNKWIGFCQYRKFWGAINSKKITSEETKSYENFNKLILKKIPNELLNTDVILTDNFFVNQFKFSKFIKHNFRKIILNPEFLFNKNKRTIKFHFDMWHGDGNLDLAIKKLPKKEQNDFEHFVNTEISFNSQNMFICKNKNLLFSYYESVFPWLMDCESLFGFSGLKTFGLKRIYGFLAERYLSYWFKKYASFKTLPYIFKDISDFL